MNRPVLGTISILALMGGGIYFALNYKDKPPEVIRKSYVEAAARSVIQESLGLPLPANAGGVHCMVENLERTKLVYARFDVADLSSLFELDDRFPASKELVADAPLLHAMAELADPLRPWWQLDQVTGAICAQKSGKRNVAPAALKWRMQVCAIPLTDSGQRVFIAFSEEPVEEK